MQGQLIFTWLLSQSTDCTTKEEYDRSHEELSQFLYLPEVVGVLGEDCINAVISLQENLRSKESKLAGYMRNDIKSCMDACTTSPVEGNNRVIKHGPSFINSRMNLDKTMARLMKGVNNRLQRRRNRARRELNETNNASCAPTKDYVIRKGQALIDRNYDARLHQKSSQLGPLRFISWNFDPVDAVEVSHDLELYRPMFYRVHELKVKQDKSGKYFFPCSCKGRDKEGVPCTCYFTVADQAGVSSQEIIDLSMIDV